MNTMPAILSILLATGSGHVCSDLPIAVAFTAKFYEPEGNTIPSQVYVSDLHGGNRIRLSDPRGASCTDVQWIGRDTLCWLECHPEGRTDLVVCDLGKRKPVRFSQQLGFDVEGPVTHRVPMRGLPVFAILRGDCTIDVHGKTKPIPPPPAVPPRVTATFNRKKLGEVSFVVPRREPKGYWVVAGDYSPTQYSERLYTFNQETGETQLILRRLAGVEIDPRSDYWTATDSTEFVGKSRRMESFGYVGSLKTGRRWQITFGQVWTSNVQLRPGI